MDSADVCYVGCPTCPCPEVYGIFNKNICQTNASVQSLLDSQYSFKIANPDARQGQTCVYQARVSIYGDGELLIPKNSLDDQTDLCIGSSDEGFSDVFEIEFPKEIELMSEISEFRNYAFNGYYEKFEVTVDVFRNSSNTPNSTNCDDYTPVEKEDCEEETSQDSDDQGSADDCTCSWESSDEDFSYEHESNYNTEKCKIPRCYPCSHDVTGTALVDRGYIGTSYGETSSQTTTADDMQKIKTYFLPTVYPFNANLNVDYSVKGLKVYTKPINISTATKYRPGTESSNVSEITLYSSELGVPVSKSDTIEVEINAGESNCECDCIFGWKDSTSESSTANYSPENSYNEDLVTNELNYYNNLCALGNCKLESESGGPQNINWFRFSLRVGNLLKNNFGHNCKYAFEVSLITGSDEKYSDTFELDLSKLVKDADTADRSRIKDYTIEKTIKLSADDDTSIRDAIFKVCAVSGKSSTSDGYTTTPRTTEYECECCQEYDSRYFNDYRELKPKKCIPCSKSDVIYDENFSVGLDNQYYYNTEMSGTFLMYANTEVNGKQQRILLGNGTSETYNHQVYIETISSDDSNSSGSTAKIIHDID